MRQSEDRLPIGGLEEVANVVVSRRGKIRSSNPWVSVLLASTALVLLPNSATLAACVLSPTAGNDTFTCDSGDLGGGLNDTSGNNTLTFPAGGTGTLSGNVTFGSGSDRIVVFSEGRISGSVTPAEADDVTMGNLMTGATAHA